MSSDGPIHVFYWPLEMVDRVQRQSSHIVFHFFFFFFQNRRLTRPRRHCYCRVGAFSPSIAKMAKVHYHSVCVWSEMAFRRVFPVCFGITFERNALGAVCDGTGSMRFHCRCSLTNNNWLAGRVLSRSRYHSTPLHFKS